MLQIRIAKPTLNFDLVKKFYVEGFGFQILGEFVDHDGFDGIMIGSSDSPYHFEFIKHKTTPIKPSSSSEDLIIIYQPNYSEWKKIVDCLENLNFETVKSHNPYWDKKGKTFLDGDGYRVVIQNSSWNS